MSEINEVAAGQFGSRKRVLPPSALRHRAEHHRNHWFCRVPADWAIDDALAASAWIHFQDVREGDLIEILSDGGRFDVLVRVISSFSGNLSFRVLRRWEAKDLQSVSGPGRVDEIAGSSTAAVAASDAKLRKRFVPSIGWRIEDDQGQVIEVIGKDGEQAEARLQELSSTKPKDGKGAA